ncbi:hypothetical protein EYZ11_008980 [Aspergillus tanneri]|uniref:Uncharacterized protein n=1 Tax=Aspergillus tanneri TaxID=1220188 RepID=A0A4S3JEK6_9EURO|nr:hypothetical protein EYZ11_008980 [Aspergillus tanneri]
MIQFSTVSFLYASGSNLGDFQFLLIDLALILPIAIFMGWTGPYPVLSRKRPTADLVSRKVLTPLLGQILICVLTQLLVYKTVQLQPWFKPPKIDLENSNIENSENTALFLISIFQYTLASVVLSVGPPFRMAMRSNKPFISVIILDLIVSCYMLFKPSHWVQQIMQLTFLSRGFAFWLFTLAIYLLGPSDKHTYSCGLDIKNNAASTRYYLKKCNSVAIEKTHVKERNEAPKL